MFQQYINYWRIIYDRFIKLFRCIDCEKRFINDKIVKIYIKFYKLVILEIIDQENKYFKDLGGCLLCFFGFLYDRLNIMEEDKVVVKRK